MDHRQVRRLLQRHTEQQISLRDLLRKAGTLTADANEVATLASRLSRLDRQLTDAERAELAELGGQPLKGIVRGLVDAVAPEQLNPATQAGPEAVRELLAGALRPLAANPQLRDRILEIRRAHDITIGAQASSWSRATRPDNGTSGTSKRFRWPSTATSLPEGTRRGER